MVDEHYSIFTTTTLKQGFYDPNQPENHTNKRELEKQSKRVGEKKTTTTTTTSFVIFILWTLEAKEKHIPRLFLRAVWM